MRFIHLNTGEEIPEIAALQLSDRDPVFDVEPGQMLWLGATVYVCFAIVKAEAFCLPHPLADKLLQIPHGPNRKAEADRMHLAYLAQGWMVAGRLGEYVGHDPDGCDQAITVRREEALLGNDGVWRRRGSTVLDPQPPPCSYGLAPVLSQGHEAGVLSENEKDLPLPLTIPEEGVSDTSFNTDGPIEDVISRLAWEVAARRKKYLIAATVNHLSGNAVEQSADRAAIAPIVGTLCDAARRAEEAVGVLQKLAIRTGKGEVTDTGIKETGLGVDLTAEVLLNLIDNPACLNFAHFQITRKGEVRAVVTIQKPDGKTPIELFRALNAKHTALTSAATEVYTGGEFGDGGATYTAPGQAVRDLGSVLGLRNPKEETSTS